MPGSPPDGLRLRPATAADSPALIAIWDAAMRQSLPGLDAAVLQREREAMLSDYLPRTRTTLAEDGPALGFVSVAPTGHIAGLFVDPAHQRRGIGGLLLTHATGALGGVNVDVAEANLNARAFYHRAKFAETGRRFDADTGLWLLTLRLG